MRAKPGDEDSAAALEHPRRATETRHHLELGAGFCRAGVSSGDLILP